MAGRRVAEVGRVGEWEQQVGETKHANVALGPIKDEAWESTAVAEWRRREQARWAEQEDRETAKVLAETRAQLAKMRIAKAVELAGARDGVEQSTPTSSTGKQLEDGCANHASAQPPPTTPPSELPSAPFSAPPNSGDSTSTDLFSALMGRLSSLT